LNVKRKKTVGNAADKNGPAAAGPLVIFSSGHSCV
jgi:hypothetical protein